MCRVLLVAVSVLSLSVGVYCSCGGCCLLLVVDLRCMYGCCLLFGCRLLPCGVVVVFVDSLCGCIVVVWYVCIGRRGCCWGVHLFLCLWVCVWELFGIVCCRKLL